MDTLRLRTTFGCLAGVLLSLGTLGNNAGAATYRTRNFNVVAPTQATAKAVGDRAEVLRKSIAHAWLGKTLPDWQAPCPIRVNLTGGEAGGVTTFDFDEQRKLVTSQRITVEGSLERILASALPHEITHTIFAAFYGGPMPRWADEGASLLSEDRRELTRQNQILAGLLARRGEMHLSDLFRQEEYPPDLLGFYGQGYSVSRFLVEIGGRPRFLRFVGEGRDTGWDAAARKHYGLANCRELDRAWKAWYQVVMVEKASPNGTDTSRIVAVSEPGGDGRRLQPSAVAVRVPRGVE